MARLARLPYPRYCYHITHRANRPARVFVEDDDRGCYLAWLQRYKERYGMRIWAHCLMSKHVHLLAEPVRENSLALAVGHGTANTLRRNWIACYTRKNQGRNRLRMITQLRICLHEIGSCPHIFLSSHIFYLQVPGPETTRRLLI